MTNRLAQPRFSHPVVQKGVVLLVALIFLVLLTLLAIGASSGTLLQQRMVSATRNAQLATMSANTALRGAEWSIWSTSAKIGASLDCDAGSISATTGCVRRDPLSTLYAPGGAVAQFRADNNVWLPSIGVTYKGLGGAGYTSGYFTANLAQDPHYIIEDLGLVLPPGSGPQHEDGVTGTSTTGAGTVILHIFRITARATGGNQNTVRVVQSTFDAPIAN